MEQEPGKNNPIVLEVIVCSVADAIEAERGGAHRLEIISHFEAGGLTPPCELVREIRAAVSLPLRVMLRESNSYEVTDEAEIERLCALARDFNAMEVEGAVLGFLHAGEIDIALTRCVLACAPALKATFHHAFDETQDPLRALAELRKLNQVDRALTSGTAFSGCASFISTTAIFVITFLLVFSNLFPHPKRKLAAYPTNEATHRLCGALRSLQVMNADGAAAASRAVYDGQTRRAMLVEFPARFFNWLIRAATRRRGAHDLFDANFRSVPVISRHTVAYVALGDDSDQTTALFIFNHWCAAAA